MHKLVRVLFEIQQKDKKNTEHMTMMEKVFSQVNVSLRNSNHRKTYHPNNNHRKRHHQNNSFLNKNLSLNNLNNEFW
jgi:hypothetical protein